MDVYFVGGRANPLDKAQGFIVLCGIGFFIGLNIGNNGLYSFLFSVGGNPLVLFLNYSLY